MVISQIFPLYVTLFPPNHAYAVFGVFLVLTFWLYLVGWVFVLGAELNAFLQEPARSVALAEATSAAAHGRAQYNEQTGNVKADVKGSAPALQGGGVLGSPSRSSAAQVGEQADANSGSGSGQVQQPGERSPKPSLAGRVLGFVGLIVAALLLKGSLPKAASDEKAAAST
jgi:hypothetical protein